METVKKFLNYYNSIERWTCIIMMIVMVVVIFAQVVTRYVFGQALYWSEEFGKFIFVWVSWLGISAGLNEKEHIQVLMVPNAFHKKGFFKIEKVNYMIINVLWFITSIVVAYYGFQIVNMQMGTGVYGASTGIPMWICYLCVPFSSILVCIRLIIEIINDSLELSRMIVKKNLEGVK